MRTKLAPIAFSLALIGSLFSAQAQADELLFDYVGYDYESPDPNSAIFGEVGSGYNGVGFVPVMFSPLTPDTVNNQYTYHITGLISNTVTPVGSFVIIDYSGPGTLRVYEDSKNTGTAADYGINPPNGTAPSSFTDGTLFLEGSISAFQIILNTSTNSGSYEASYMATGGSQLGNIPVNKRTGWTFAGLTGNEINAPEGYAHQVDGQVFVTEITPVEPTTWGQIKNGFGR